MRPLRKILIAGTVLLSVGVTVALAAIAGPGVWLLAVVLAGLVGLLATLIGVGLSETSRGPFGTGPRIDPVTALPDGEQLRADLKRALSGPRHVLFTCDLDGLKRYNDAYGEQCGDALLGWMGRKLRDAVGDRAVVYRLHGGSFAVLAAGREQVTDQIRADATAALFEIGDGFAIWASVGAAVLPQDADTPEEALERADRRAHAPGAEATAHVDPRPPADPIEVLPHVQPPFDVGELSKRVAGRLGLPTEELDNVEAAAHLRDVGTAALPTAILAARGKLPEPEWSFIELHPVVGERLIAGTFGMERVAVIVRSSHERWDGAGYPDGLRGERIPLESRIVFVCCAYQDMTSERAHRRALNQDEALAELARASGTQFDPRVVKEFTHELAPPQGRAHSNGSGMSAVLSALRAVGAGDSSGSIQATDSRRHIRVLVADPDPVSRFLLRRAVGNTGHECLAVEDGLAAWETYERALPDAVVVATTLPRLDGLELCERIRAGGAGAYLVLLVGPGQATEFADGIPASIDSVIERPISPRDLEIRLSGARQTTISRQRSEALAG